MPFLSCSHLQWRLGGWVARARAIAPNTYFAKHWIRVENFHCENYLIKHGTLTYTHISGKPSRFYFCLLSNWIYEAFVTACALFFSLGSLKIFSYICSRFGSVCMCHFLSAIVLCLFAFLLLNMNHGSLSSHLPPGDWSSHRRYSVAFLVGTESPVPNPHSYWHYRHQIFALIFDSFFICP